MRRLTSWGLSILLASSILAWFLIRSSSFLHWFVLPLWACGVLMGVDAVRWARGKVHVLDPAGLLGLLFLIRFYWAYLYKVDSGFWLRHPYPPSDWRPWVGWLSVIYLGAILLYRWAVRWAQEDRRRTAGASVAWRIEPRRFIRAVVPLLLASLLAQVALYARFGGISGFIEAYERRDIGSMGWLATIGEPLPIIALMGWAVYVRERRVRPSWTAIAAVFIALFTALLFFGGLRGSRSNTIWGCIWGAFIVHAWVRPIPRQLFLSAIPFLVLSLYLWGFYKGAGREGLRAVLEPSRWGEVAEEKGRTVRSAWIPGGTETMLVYRLAHPESDYRYAWGRTYLGTLAKLVPRKIWPDRPPGPVLEGTEALYGRGSYSEVWRSSLVYGLLGEGMLNFGLYLAPLTYLLLGYVVGRVRRGLRSLSPDDARWLLAPFLANLCIQLQGGDSPNVLFFLVKTGTVPVLLIWVSSRRERSAKHPR
ncbi:MAG: hypothetical protein ACUVYA_17720 [Planctomycetota bacterium]